MFRQREIGQKIVTLTKEIDFAIKRDSNIKVQQEDDRKNILESKLKPKGHLLIQKSNK